MFYKAADWRWRHCCWRARTTHAIRILSMLQIDRTIDIYVYNTTKENERTYKTKSISNDCGNTDASEQNAIDSHCVQQRRYSHSINMLKQSLHDCRFRHCCCCWFFFLKNKIPWSLVLKKEDKVNKLKTETKGILTNKNFVLWLMMCWMLLMLMLLLHFVRRWWFLCFEKKNRNFLIQYI